MYSSHTGGLALSAIEKCALPVTSSPESVAEGGQTHDSDDNTEQLILPAWSGGNAPDGGRGAWFCVLGTWCSSVCAFGWLNSAGVFQQYYEADPLHQYSSSTISWVPSLQIFFMMAMVSF
ncbi:hypothetical protein PENSOL_c001G10544 [Penicillium solitum]|uniref:Uncharacterized protein n=1 Tax=Penicillium solitum TaxID=60172 RepID=A0A1V6RQC8_9EURO|nr:uncharacterized protein PENSOL_c001G10544 [Penicillium solitum]OQE03740.1 hypothetical protein PENSOL_c001G10544 [Penicillium solitum]